MVTTVASPAVSRKVGSRNSADLQRRIRRRRRRLHDGWMNCWAPFDSLSLTLDRCISRPWDGGLRGARFSPTPQFHSTRSGVATTVVKNLLYGG